MSSVEKALKELRNALGRLDAFAIKMDSHTLYDITFDIESAIFNVEDALETEEELIV